MSPKKGVVTAAWQVKRLAGARTARCMLLPDSAQPDDMIDTPHLQMIFGLKLG
jgi:hypothetical protein